MFDWVLNTPLVSFVNVSQDSALNIFKLIFTNGLYLLNCCKLWLKWSSMSTGVWLSSLNDHGKQLVLFHNSKDSRNTTNNTVLYVIKVTQFFSRSLKLSYTPQSKWKKKKKDRINQQCYFVLIIFEKALLWFS